jgi:hypothetical protein
MASYPLSRAPKRMFENYAKVGRDCGA